MDGPDADTDVPMTDGAEGEQPQPQPEPAPDPQPQQQEQPEQQPQLPDAAVAQAAKPPQGPVVDYSVTCIPADLLDALEKTLRPPNWKVPVHPGQALDVCMRSCISLIHQGKIAEESCQRFLHGALTSSFEKLLGDKAVLGWQAEILHLVHELLTPLMEIVIECLKAGQPLFEIMNLLFRPSANFYLKNEMMPSLSDAVVLGEDGHEAGQQFATARPAPHHMGWLVDVYNQFGEQDGFDLLLQYLQSHADDINAYQVSCLVSPFGPGAVLLTEDCITKHFVPILAAARGFLESLVDAKLKEQTKFLALNDALYWLCQGLKLLSHRLQPIVEASREFDTMLLGIIKRLLEGSSYNGAMYALNELKRLTSDVRKPAEARMFFYGYARHPEEWLSPQRLADWMVENDLVAIVLKNNLHQQQYVMKLQPIFSFLTNEQRLSREHLSAIWDAQTGKHEAIVANVQEMLTKLAYVFDTEQLDHLFHCFQESWRAAQSTKTMEKLLVFVQNLAEDDAEGNMAPKVMELLWVLAHGEDTPRDIMEVAISSLVRILDMGYFGDAEGLKISWIERCVEDLVHHRWVVPAMKTIQQISGLFKQSRARNFPGMQRAAMVQQIHKRHNLKGRVVAELVQYCKKARPMLAKHPEIQVVMGPFPHDETIQHFLRFIKFILWDGQLWLELDEARSIWENLVEKPPRWDDYDVGLEWIANTVGQEPDLEDASARALFEEKVLMVNHRTITSGAFFCFQYFFNHCNGLLRRDQPMEPNLLGLSYLWSVSLECPEPDIAERAILMLKDTQTRRVNAPSTDRRQAHSEFIDECMQHMTEAQFAITRNRTQSEHERQDRLRCIERCLQLLHHYVVVCDDQHYSQRSMVPHGSAYMGENVTVYVVQTNNRSHVVLLHSNAALWQLRQKVAQVIKAAPQRVGMVMHNLDGSRVGLGHQFDQGLLREHGVRSGVSIRSRLLAEPSKYLSPSSFPPDHATEMCLPGVLCSERTDIVERLFSFAEMSDSPSIQKHARLLLDRLPSDPAVLERYRLASTDSDLDVAIYANAQGDAGGSARSHGSWFRLRYNLECLAELVIPANAGADASFRAFSQSFVELGGVTHLLGVLEEPSDFVEPDSVRLGDLRGCLRITVRLLKALLLPSSSPMAASRQQKQRAAVTGRAGAAASPGSAPSPASTTGDSPARSVGSPGSPVSSWPTGVSPEQLARLLMPLVWAASTSRLNLGKADLSLRDNLRSPGEEDELLAVEGMELLAYVLGVHPAASEAVFSMPQLPTFVRDVLLECSNGNIRASANRGLAGLTADRRILDHLWPVCEAMLGDVEAHATTCVEFFDVVCKLCPQALENQQPRVVEMLDREVEWIKDFQGRPPDVRVNQQPLLTGHLQLTCRLVGLVPSRKLELGSLLLPMLFDEFLFSASKLIQAVRSSKDTVPIPDEITPCCTVSMSKVACFGLITELASGCSEVFKAAFDRINTLFFQPQDALEAWECHPPVLERQGDYVGLKNPCATCYMNSVLQQLYMQPVVRSFVSEVALDEQLQQQEGSEDENILFQTQCVFAHLLESQMQFFEPNGFWRAYRHYGQPVDIREQQDAREFFDNLVDQLDEKLKAAGKPQVLSRVFGGLFADQKIIQSGCTHCYEKEESFSALAIDVRNQTNLNESLAQYVKGDLLEGANAYRCEKCDELRDCVKRTCFKRLPRVLVIHLKRFDYDWDRDQPVKFNDMFEFPTHLDMAPYTVDGVTAKDLADKGKRAPKLKPCMYRLTGVLVHSGQANGGHYYSFVRKPGGTDADWLRFDDIEVTELQMDEGGMEREWFGGSFVAQDVWDSHFKRYTNQTRERMWNAYMLFYERVEPLPLVLDGEMPPEVSFIDTEGSSQDSEAMSVTTPPEAALSAKPNPPDSVKRLVQEHNIVFHHQREMFSPEFLSFIRSLGRACLPHLPPPLEQQGDEPLGRMSFELVLKFVVCYVARTEKTLRGLMTEWTDTATKLLAQSPTAVLWFVSEVTQSQQQLVKQMLLECPTYDVRVFFYNVLKSVFQNLFRFWGEEHGLRMSASLWNILIPLLGTPRASLKQLAGIFRLVNDYALIGPAQRRQLLANQVLQDLLNLFHTQMVNRYHQHETPAGQLHTAISTLARGIDFTHAVAAQPGQVHTQSPYAEMSCNAELGSQPEGLFPATPELFDLMYKGNYVYEAIREVSGCEGLTRLLCHMSWNTGSFSAQVLNIINDRLATVPATEFRPYLAMLQHLFQIEDRLQTERIHYAFWHPVQQQDGGYQEAAGLVAIMDRHRHRFPKRTYMCFKFISEMLSVEPVAQALRSEALFPKWSWAPQWLWQQFQAPTYGQYEPPSPGASNENSSGYQFERTDSARNLLEQMRGFLPQGLAARAPVMSQNPDDYHDANDVSSDEDSDDGT